MNFEGILLVDKPKGWTSHDVVAKIRGIIKSIAGHKVKVGHTGTLDPLATGLMVVVIGNYTKRAQEFSKLDKTYEVEMVLGKKSNTGDGEGTLSEVSGRQPDKDELLQALQNFIGQIKQTPPPFSAIKVDGRRAYKLAREGKDVKLEPRKVTIYDINLMDYAYPDAKFIANVSSGTYIRSLVEDTGISLGTGAYLSNLRRTNVGKFELKKAHKIDDPKLLENLKAYG